MRPAPLRLLALTLLLLAPATALAEPHNGGAAVALFPSGIRVPFCVVPQPDSGALVVYQDTRNGVQEVYAQRVDRHGRPTLGPGGKLVWTNLGTAFANSFIPDGSGGCVFAWSENRGATGQDVLVQRVLADGSIVYPASGLVVCNAAFDQTNPLLVAGPAGSYYVTWTDARANLGSQTDLYVQRLNLAGTAQFAGSGLLINTAAFRPGTYAYPSVASDLLGGMLIAWNAYSPGGIRAQRVGSTGALQYTATGVPLADPSDANATIAPDGSGGLWAYTTRYVSGWTPYGHHLTSTGTSSFVPAGIALHSSTQGSYALSLVRDASGGCFFVGQNYQPTATVGNPLIRQQLSAAGSVLRGTDGEVLAGYNNIYSFTDAGSCVLLMTFDDDIGHGTYLLRVQRFAFDGTPAYPGLGIVAGRDEQTAATTAFAASATSSLIVMEAHADGRYNRAPNPFNYQAFGQALDSAGNPLWDDAENPTAAAASDAPLDQGGLVRVAWNASAEDSPSAKMLAGYHAWRALGTAPAAMAASLRPAADVPFTAGDRRYVVHSGLYWEMVGAAPAAQLDAYAVTVPTGQDSTAAGSADESFMVEAYDDSVHHWWSGTLVAHSVDNLPPATPAPFTGEYVAGTSHLHWHRNTEADLVGYRLYRGTSATFVPGLASLIGTPPDTGWADPYGATAIYKLSAIDVHGNESPFATLTPNGALGVDGGPARALAFALVSGNPTRSGATLRLDLPAAAPVRVAIYDVTGREVRALADGERPAGEWTLDWDGADGAGAAAASGLYFARLSTAGRSFTVRIAMTR